MLKDFLMQEESETMDEFKIRRELTEKILSLGDEGLKINNATASVCAFMILKKAKYDVGYDTKIEAVLNFLQEKLIS